MLEKIQVHTVEAFVLKVTLPLLYDLPDGQVTLFGTGTLFSLLGRYFVITAAHPFWESHIEPSRIAFPERPIVDGPIHLFNQFQLLTPQSRVFDVAALELQDGTVLSILQRHWQFLTRENVSSPKPIGRSFLTGFPEKLFHRAKCGVYGKPFTIYSDPLPRAPDDATEPVTPGLDLFFGYDREAQTLDGTGVETPNLKGVSGASVWQLQPIAPGSVWSAERAIRVIGVQSASAHSQYFRAQNWWAVARLLGQLDTAFEEHLFAILDRANIST